MLVFVLLLFSIIFSIIPITFIAFIQLIFCRLKYKVLQFIPLAASLGFIVWCAIEQAQIQKPDHPVGCGMVEVIGNTTIGIILIVLFGGIALGWFTYIREKESEE